MWWQLLSGNLDLTFCFLGNAMAVEGKWQADQLKLELTAEGEGLKDHGNFLLIKMIISKSCHKYSQQILLIFSISS